MRRFMILMSLLCLVAAGCGSRRTPEEAAAIRASRAGAVQAPGPEAGTAGSESDSAAPSAAPASETETGVAAPAPSAPAAPSPAGSAASTPAPGPGQNRANAQAPGAARAPRTSQAPAGGPKAPARAGAPAPGGAPAPAPGGAPAVGGPQVEPTYDQGITDDEILIGLTGPLSGIFGFYGEEMIAGLDSYAKLINEAGGIGGRKIRLISYDDRFEPTQILTNVKRLVERDKVFAVFGLWMDAAMGYLTQKKIPTLTMGVTAPPYSSKFPTVFPLQANVLTWNQQLAEAVTQHMGIQPKRIGIIYDTTLFDERPYLPYFEETWAEFGAEVVALEPMNLSDGDCTSVALKMQSAQIDFWNFETLAWPLCVTAMDRIGWEPPMGMGGWGASAAGVGDIVGPSVEGIIAMNIADQPSGAPRTKTAAHDRYVAAVTKYYPKMNTQGHLESSATLGYYTGMQLFGEALKGVGSTFTRAAIVDWLHNVKNFDNGLQPPITSLAADCKQGTGQTWWAKWQWDPEKKEAFRVPETPYVDTSRFAEKYGSECFVTNIANKIVGG